MKLKEFLLVGHILLCCIWFHFRTLEFTHNLYKWRKDHLLVGLFFVPAIAIDTPPTHFFSFLFRYRSRSSPYIPALYSADPCILCNTKVPVLSPFHSFSSFLAVLSVALLLSARPQGNDMLPFWSITIGSCSPVDSVPCILKYSGSLLSVKKITSHHSRPESQRNPESYVHSP